MDGNTAFANALERAKAIAAKIGGSFGPAPTAVGGLTNPAQAGAQADLNLDGSGGLKRPLEENTDNNQPPTKSQAMDGRGFSDSGDFLPSQGNHLGIIQQMRLGGAGAATGAGIPKQQAQLAPGQKRVTHFIPDAMVGLVIGSHGETIKRIQAESSCQIQIAQERSGNSDKRECTLTGTPESIEDIKMRINNIISQAQTDGGTTEMSIPPGKVGLIIGTGGETIKNLQAQLGVKMEFVQETTANTGESKTLKIKGDPIQCQEAQKKVQELMAGTNRSYNDSNDYGGSDDHEIEVPKALVGMVIGRGGEMIKRIQSDTETRVQFKEDDPNSLNRTAIVKGEKENVQNAVKIINDILDNHNNRRGRWDGSGDFDNFDGPPDFNHPQGGFRGRGRGRGGFRGGRGGGYGGRGGYNNDGPGGPPFGQDDSNAAKHVVPEDKCGFVIGKGGSAIRQIQEESGANVEISRVPGSHPFGKKLFFIRGTEDQVAHAKFLIDKKVNEPRMNQGGPHDGPHHGGPGGPHGGPGMGPPPGQGNYNPHGPPGGPPMHHQPQQQGYGQPWGNQYQQPWQQPQQAPQQQPSHDPSKPQDHMAAWNAYYQQQQQQQHPYYQQQQQQPMPNPAAPQATSQAPAAQQQAAPATSQPAAQPAAGAPAMPGQVPPPVGGDPAQMAEYYRQQASQAGVAAQSAISNAAAQPGQPDYSSQWAEYYRQLQAYYNQQATLALQGNATAPPSTSYQTSAAAPYQGQ